MHTKQWRVDLFLSEEGDVTKARAVLVGDSPKRVTLRAPRSAADDVTPRERDVVVLIAEGGTNRQIATRLGVTERTARTHVSNILGKLGLASRTQAAMWAVRHGLVPAQRSSAE